MTISTYAELKTAVGNWLNRSTLTTYIPDFIALAESRIAYGSKENPFPSDPLRIRAMEQAADLTVNAQSISLPSSYLQTRRLYINSNPIVKPSFVVPELFWETWISSETGLPTEYTIEGENIIFGPSPDASYTGKILYYKKLTALSADSDTNWLLTNSPGAYLHGALLEAYRFSRNTDQALIALNAFTGIINALNSADKADRYSGTPWTARTDTGSP